MAITNIRDAISQDKRLFTEPELEEMNKLLDVVEKRESAITCDDKADLGVSKKAAELLAAGNAEFKARNYLEAIDKYSEAIDETPENAVLYSNRAAAYGMLDILDSGVEDCLKAIELNPNFTKAYIRLGDFYSKSDVEKARDNYEKAVALDPENSSAISKLEKLDHNVAKPSSEEMPDLASLMKDPKFKEMMESEEFKNLMSDAKKNPDFMKNFKGL